MDYYTILWYSLIYGKFLMREKQNKCSRSKSDSSTEEQRTKTKKPNQRNLIQPQALLDLRALSLKSTLRQMLCKLLSNNILCA